MKTRTWTAYGFWMVLGLAAGLILADLTNAPTAKASGSASFYEDYRIVTGFRSDTGVDVVWLLDYRQGMLHCVMLNQQTSRLEQICELDLIEQFELKEGSKERPHFMMVTGAYQPQATDACYLAEVTTGQLLCIMPPFVKGRTLRGPRSIAKAIVVDRFYFRKRPPEVRAQ